MLGGYWGEQSHAGSAPNDGDLYLEAQYEVTEDGQLGKALPRTNGVLLRREEYSYIELIRIPQE